MHPDGHQLARPRRAQNSSGGNYHYLLPTYLSTYLPTYLPTYLLPTPTTRLVNSRCWFYTGDGFHQFLDLRQLLLLLLVTVCFVHTRPQEVVAGTSLSQAKFEHTNQKKKDSEKNTDSD